MTIHGAKGLEADYAIIGLRGGGWGFPSQIIDDPLLDLVLTQADEYPFGEERRLFYVAITRSRNKSYLVCETEPDQSVFAAELESGNEYPVNVFGVDTKKLQCPKCKSGIMLLRDGSNGHFYGCSNYPLCGYTEQTCPKCRKGFLIKGEDRSFSCHLCDYQARMCPRCETGVLQLRTGEAYGAFYGCSNYNDPDIKCRYKENVPVLPLNQ